MTKTPRRWDRIRFGNENADGDTPNVIYQGFYDGWNMAGVDVLVTADTLRRFIDDCEAQMNEWDKVHNPIDENDVLAFGGETRYPNVHLAPDGITPVYLLSGYALSIVQVFDPLGGKSYNVVAASGEVAETRRWGAWVNVSAPGGKPIPYGFVINPDYDTPFLTEEPEVVVAPEVVVESAC